MTASHLRLLDKQRELQAFMAVEVEGARLRAYLDGFGDKMNILEEGTEGIYSHLSLCLFFLMLTLHWIGLAVSKVVEHWQNVFRATQLALGELLFLPATITPLNEHCSNDSFVESTKRSVCLLDHGGCRSSTGRDIAGKVIENTNGV